MTSQPSSTPFPHLAPDNSSIWDSTITNPVFQDTPTFYQRLLGSPPTVEQCQELATAIEKETLAGCSDGAYDRTTSIASHGLVLADRIQRKRIASGAGPVDGHPHLLSSFRAELSGILAAV